MVGVGIGACAAGGIRTAVGPVTTVASGTGSVVGSIVWTGRVFAARVLVGVRAVVGVVGGIGAAVGPMTTVADAGLLGKTGSG